MEEFAPDVFVVDKLPRGIGHELVTTLGRLRKTGTRCVLGLRDVLDQPDIVASEWLRDSNDEAIEAFYDELWIYGDKSIYDCLEEYRFTSTVSSRAFFTGYLNQTSRKNNYSAHSPEPLTANSQQVLCVVGGDRMAFSLPKLRASYVATRLAWHCNHRAFHAQGRAAQLRQLAQTSGNIEIIDRLVETDDYLREADRVIAMGGYNTITSILSFNKPSLIVPRITPRKEQWIRAERLADRGWISVLSPLELNHDRLNQWLHATDVPKPVAEAVD